MAKVACIGTVLQESIASSYTAVAQVISISRSGTGDETFDADTLDLSADGNGTIWAQKINTGIAQPGKVSFELFLDATLTGHQAIVSRVGQGNTSWKMIYPSSGGTADAFVSAGLQYGVDVKLGDGVKMSVDLELTGAVTQF